MDDEKGIVRLGMPYDQKPKQKDLQRFIVRYGKHWRSIGLELGLEECVLDEVTADDSGQSEWFRRILVKWIELGVEVTWRRLELAISNANRMSLSLEPLTAIPLKTYLTTTQLTGSPKAQESITTCTGQDNDKESELPSKAPVQLGIFFAFEKLHGQFYEKYKKSTREEIAHLSNVLHTACKKLHKCSVKFSKRSVEKIFDELSNLPFHNFLDVDLLTFLAASTSCQELTDSVEAYKSTYFSQTLKEVIEDNCKYIEKIQIIRGRKIFNIRRTVTESISTKFLKDMTIDGLKKYTINFANKILCIEGSLASPISFKDGCISVEWLIPSQLTDYVYHSACINTELFFELELSQLDIGKRYRVVPVKGSDGYPPKNPVQIFCEHYYLLLESLEPTSFLLKCKMQQRLLNDAEVDFIQTAPIDFMKNLYIMEKIRNMGMPHLFTFLDIFKETCDQQYMHIRGTIVKALELGGFTQILEEDSTSLHSYVGVVKAETLDPPACIFEFDADELKSSLEKFKSGRKRLLLSDVNKQEYFHPSVILLKYLDFFDNLVTLSQSINPKILIDSVSNILVMAASNYCVNQFCVSFIKQLSCCANSTEVLVKLSPYFNWCDHSFLRELLEICNCFEGIQLVDEFDSRIDLLCPIQSYPMPAPSPLFIPNNSSYYTVMAIKCKQKLCSLSLHHIRKIKSELMQKCNLYRHACLFLTITKCDPAISYWLIPRILIFSISDALEKFAGSLYENGILEIAIHSIPFSFSTTGINSSVVSSSYFMPEVTDDNASSKESHHNTEFGGYDCEFVSKLEDRLLCKICKLPCHEAQISGCCGHSFCKSCLERVKEYSNHCPLCRKSKIVTISNIEADRLIKTQHIYCLNKHNGCQWTGQLNNINEHIVNGECRDKICGNCKEIVHHTVIKDHPAACPCYCQHCDITAAREVISSQHKGNCKKLPIPCPNNCGETITADNLTEHRDTCPCETIECEYSDIGCKARFHRSKQNKHNAEMKAYHRQLMGTSAFLYTFSSFILIYITIASLNMIIYIPQSPTITNHKLEVVNLNTWKQFGEMPNNIYVAPVILTLSNFSERFNNSTSWYSAPFLTFERGYQMRLRINIDQYDKDKYISVYVHLMQGPYDDELQESGKWPLRGNFTIDLINQLNYTNYHSHTFLLNYDICIWCTYRVHPLQLIVTDFSYGYGISKFIRHDTIYQNNSAYVINNTVYFKLSYDHTGYQPSIKYYVNEYLLWSIPFAVLIWIISMKVFFIDLSWLKSPQMFINIWFLVIVASFPEGIIWIISCAAVICLSVIVGIYTDRSGNVKLYIISTLGSVILARVLLTVMPLSVLKHLRFFIYFIIGLAHGFRYSY